VLSPAFPRVKLDAALQQVRQAVATLVNPSPHFDVRPLLGPNAGVSLDADRAILCIRIPWSPNTPHIHKSGRIYRRVADGSEPKPENDRFLLDQLWRRADKLREQYAQWVEKDPEFSKAEAERPFVRLLLVADLWHDRDFWSDLSLEDVRAIMQSIDGLGSTVPFEPAFPG
jgi:hypothetical protein